MNLPRPEDLSINKASSPITTDIKRNYLTYLITNSGTYSYDIKYDSKNIPVFIVGNEKEKELAVVPYPFVLTTNGMNYIISNARGIVRADISNSLYASKKSDTVDFEVVRNMMLFMSTAGKDFSGISSIVAQLATIWVKHHMILKLRISGMEAVTLEALLYTFFIRHYSQDELSRDELRTKLSVYLSILYRNNFDLIDSILDKIYALPVDSMIPDYIDATFEKGFLTKIDMKPIYAMLTGTWYTGTGYDFQNIVAAVTDVHTMTAILYHAITTKVGRDTSLGRLLKDNTKFSKLDVFRSDIDNKLSDYLSK